MTTGGNRRRRAMAVLVVLAGLAALPSAASAQFAQHRKVGPVTCDLNHVERGYTGYITTTGCTLVYKNKSAFCGTRRTFFYVRRYCEIKMGTDKRIWCGDDTFSDYHGDIQFTGCTLQAAGVTATCGHSHNTQTHSYATSKSDRWACDTSVAGAGAGCSDYTINYYPDPEHRVVCGVGPVGLNCLYAGDLPGTCRVVLPPVLDCDIDLADAAGSLVACVTGAGARRRS